jgi:hypothetical protein
MATEQLPSKLTMLLDVDPNDENDERLQLPWGVKVDGVLIAAFAMATRAEQFAERKRAGIARRIELVFLGKGPRGNSGKAP